MAKLNVTKEHFVIISDILKDIEGVRVFGSRLNGNNKEFSDLDVCIKQDSALAGHQVEFLKERFEKSDLPFKVDLVDYYTLNSSFQEIIESSSVAWSELEPY